MMQKLILAILLNAVIEQYPEFIQGDEDREVVAVEAQRFVLSLGVLTTCVIRWVWIPETLRNLKPADASRIYEILTGRTKWLLRHRAGYGYGHSIYIAPMYIGLHFMRWLTFCRAIR